MADRRRLSKSSARSGKSVSFSGRSEFIPHTEVEDLPNVHSNSRHSAPPVPYFHAPDDFPIEDERCCALWPYCGDAKSAIAYSEKGSSHYSGSDTDIASLEEHHHGSGHDDDYDYGSSSAEVNVASRRPMTSVESRRISAIDLSERSRGARNARERPHPYSRFSDEPTPSSRGPGRSADAQSRHRKLDRRNMSTPDTSSTRQPRLSDANRGDARSRHRSGLSEKTLIDSWHADDASLNDHEGDQRRSYPYGLYQLSNITKGDIGDPDDFTGHEKHRESPRISVVSPERKTPSYTVKFEGPHDRNDPKNWPAKIKWRMVAYVAAFTFLSPLTSSMVAPALPDIALEFHITSEIRIEIVLSIFVLAFAIGPIVFAPLSELYGRAPILQISNVMFLAFTIACGFAQSETQIIAFRFLSGFGGSAPLAIGGGVLGDIFPPHERGKAMALYGLGPMLGPALGPMLGAFIAYYSTWRWIFWSSTAASALVLVLSFVWLKESYAPILLEAKAKRLREETGIEWYQSEFANPDQTVVRSILGALTRSLRMLLTQPIVQVLALYMAYAFGTMYLLLATFPTLWSQTYGESQQIAGLNYLSLGLGFFLGAPIFGKFNDKIYKSLAAKDLAAENGAASAGAAEKGFGTGPPPGQQDLTKPAPIHGKTGHHSGSSSSGGSRTSDNPSPPPYSTPPNESTSSIARSQRQNHKHQPMIPAAGPGQPPTSDTLPTSLAGPPIAGPPGPNGSGTVGPGPQHPGGPPPGGPPGGPPRGKPEYRLPLLIPFSFLPPIGLFLYGWSAANKLHWILPNIGAFLFSLGTVAAFQGITMYLVDAYMRYAASAIAAVTILRSAAGFGFPIFAPYMYSALGLGWGNSALGFAALAIGVPAPILLFVFGERLRKKSGFAA